MKHLIAVVAIVALVAVPASAQDEKIRLFLDEVGATGDPTFVNPVTTAGTLYLWAEMVDSPAEVHWNSVSFNILGTGDVMVTGATMYNTNVFGTDRWQGQTYNGDAFPTAEAKDFRNFYVSAGFGVTQQWGRLGFDPDYRDIGGQEVNLLGEIQFSGTGGDIFIGVGLGGIVLSGAPAAMPVYMGFGDEDSGLMGDSFDQYSRDADAAIIPEPAGLMLLGLGALALRRR